MARQVPGPLQRPWLSNAPASPIGQDALVVGRLAPWITWGQGDCFANSLACGSEGMKLRQSMPKTTYTGPVCACVRARATSM